MGCHEATSDDRQSGNFSEIPGGLGVEAVPWCFVKAANLNQEAEEYAAANGVDKNQATFEVITTARNCPSFYSWTEFISPKEHFEEYKAAQAEKDRRAFERELFDMSQRVQEDSHRLASESHSFNTKITCLVVVLALAEVLGTMAALAYPDGIPFLIDLAP
jgi:hypothetical protein